MDIENVSLTEVIAAARGRHASLVQESAGYLLLAAVRAIGRRPIVLRPAQVMLNTEGALTVVGPPTPAEDAVATASVLEVLDEILGVCQGAAMALHAIARRRPSTLELLFAELHKALIPINRAASKRAMARLARETVRAKSRGQLRPEDVYAPPATTLAPAAPTPPSAPEAVEPSPAAPVTVEATPAPASRAVASPEPEVIAPREHTPNWPPPIVAPATAETTGWEQLDANIDLCTPTPAPVAEVAAVSATAHDAASPDASTDVAAQDPASTEVASAPASADCASSPQDEHEAQGEDAHEAQGEDAHEAQGEDRSAPLQAHPQDDSVEVDVEIDAAEPELDEGRDTLHDAPPALVEEELAPEPSEEMAPIDRTQVEEAMVERLHKRASLPPPAPARTAPTPSYAKRPEEAGSAEALLERFGHEDALASLDAATAELEALMELEDLTGADASPDDLPVVRAMLARTENREALLEPAKRAQPHIDPLEAIEASPLEAPSHGLEVEPIATAETVHGDELESQEELQNEDEDELRNEDEDELQNEDEAESALTNDIDLERATENEHENQDDELENQDDELENQDDALENQDDAHENELENQDDELEELENENRDDELEELENENELSRAIESDRPSASSRREPPAWLGDRLSVDLGVDEGQPVVGALDDDLPIESEAVESVSPPPVLETARRPLEHDDPGDGSAQESSAHSDPPQLRDEDELAVIPVRRGRGRLAVAAAALALAAGVSAVAYTKPELVEMARERVLPATETKAPDAPAASLCTAEVRLTELPQPHEVLLRLGETPLKTTALPTGTRLELVAMAPGRLPERLVIPADATWTKNANLPQLSLSVELEPGSAHWPAAPAGRAGGIGPRGEVDVTSPSTPAEVWLTVAAGKTREHALTLPCDASATLLVVDVSAPERRRRIVVPSELLHTAAQGGLPATFSARP